MNENKNTTTQNLRDTVKAVLTGRFIAIQAYLKKQEKRQINNLTYTYFSSVQSLSRVRIFESPRIAAHQASLSITNSRSSLRLTSIESVPAISSSVVPFSSYPQILPDSESTPMHQLFAWGGQSTGASALASVLPRKSQGWSPSEWTGWISFQSKT